MGMRILALFCGLICAFTLEAQYYFPPNTGSQWDTVSKSSIDWCTQELDTLQKFLDAKNSKSFIILHKGKIALEWYFDSFTKDSAWYWASAGKSLAATLVGIAQEDGLVNINNKVSDYLGIGWTVAPSAKEDQITVRDQMTMTSGLDYNVPDLDCLEDTCLQYLNDAGTHWYYHNAPYRLVQDVVVSNTNLNINQYTFQNIMQPTGMTGLWLNRIFFSHARSMARFGSLILNNGTWDQTVVLGDTNYIKDMITPSQTHNPAYGYLWWLNGSNTHKLPGTDFVFNGPIIPDAPQDLYMAAGKDEQRIYIVPSLDLVVVRQGEAAGGTFLAISTFDNELWKLLNQLICNSISLVEYPLNNPIKIYPNPTADFLHIESPQASEVEVYNATGSLVIKERVYQNTIDVSSLAKGIYYIKTGNQFTSFIKQ